MEGSNMQMKESTVKLLYNMLVTYKCTGKLGYNVRYICKVEERFGTYNHARALHEYKQHY